MLEPFSNYAITRNMLLPEKYSIHLLRQLNHQDAGHWKRVDLQMQSVYTYTCMEHFDMHKHTYTLEPHERKT